MNQQSSFSEEKLNDENSKITGDCECDGDCCKPKKKKWWPKVIFAVVLLAAAGIIAAKLFFTDSKAPAANKQVVNDPNSPCWADSSGSKAGCDTTKISSCCPK